MPATVTVPAGSTSQTFTVTTTAVPTDATATISATLGAVTRTATLAIQAPPPCALTTAGAGWLAFAAGVNGVYELQVMRADGTCLATPSTATGSKFFPTWSPAKVIAYMSNKGGKLQVYQHDLVTSTDTLLDTGTVSATAPSFSPDGATIAFEGYAAGVNNASDIYVIPAAGGTPVKIGAGAGTSSGPSWSPDGAWVFFVSNRSGAHDVWKTAVAGGAAVQVTTASGILERPVVSPDGLSIAYTRSASGAAASEVVVRTLVGGATRVVSSQKDSEPAFDRTGTLLVVNSSRGGNPDLWLLTVATGAVVTQLTSGATIDSMAAFGPFP